MNKKFSACWDRFINKPFNPYIAIIILCFLCILPAFIRIAKGADTGFHLLWSREFAAQFYQGDLYPRWLHNLYGGCGIPTFYFYPPFFYWLNSLFYPLSHWGVLEGWYPIACSILLFTIAGGIFCYRWLLLHTDCKTSALGGTFIYLVMPYAAITYHAFYFITEYSVIAYLPALLYGAKRIQQGDRNAVLLYGGTQALLILTTIPGSIVISLLPIIYCLGTDRNDWLKRCVMIMTAMVIAALLSAFYWLPMLLDLEYISIFNHAADTIKSKDGVMRYDGFFVLFSGLNSVYSPFLLYILITVFLLIFFAIKNHQTLKKIATDRIRQHSFFWIIIILLTSLMMSDIAKPIWDLLLPLHLVQFPHRFSSILSIAAAILVSFYLYYHKKTQLDWVLICVVCIFMMRFEYIRFQSLPLEELIDEKELVLYQHNVTPSHDYLPRQVDHQWFKYIENVPLISQYCKQRLHFSKEKAAITITQWQAGDIKLSVKASEQFDLEIGQLYYPYWQAADSQGNNFPIHYKTHDNNPKGLVYMEQLPQGNYDLTLQLRNHPIFAWSGWVSFATFLGIMIGWITRFLKKP